FRTWTHRKGKNASARHSRTGGLPAGEPKRFLMKRAETRPRRRSCQPRARPFAPGGTAGEPCRKCHNSAVTIPQLLLGLSRPAPRSHPVSANARRNRSGSRHMLSTFRTLLAASVALPLVTG